MMGITQLFVLSTRTMQWFEERGKHELYVHLYVLTHRHHCTLEDILKHFVTANENCGYATQIEV